MTACESGMQLALKLHMMESKKSEMARFVQGVSARLRGESKAPLSLAVVSARASHPPKG